MSSTAWRPSLSLKAMNRKRPAAYVVGLFFLFAAGRATAATVMVDVAPGGVVFLPDSVTIQVGDTVMWTWKGNGHSVTSGYPGQPSGMFDSGIRSAGFTFSFTFQNQGPFSIIVRRTVPVAE